MRPENHQRLEEVLEAARHKIDDARSVERYAQDMEVTATSRDNDVAVTVNGLGKLRRLRIDPYAQEHCDPEELAKLILDTGIAAQTGAESEMRRRRLRNGARVADLPPAATPGRR